MSSSPVIERRPRLQALLRSDNLDRCLQPFLPLGVCGIFVYEVDGPLFLRVVADEEKMPAWESLPDELQHHAGIRRGQGPLVKTEGLRLRGRPLFAGADRVGLVVFAFCHPTMPDSKCEQLAEALAGVMTAILQAGFATWVTSEMHLEVSETSYNALQQQHFELKRAIEHLQEIDKLKSNFLATVSHELRTPLTSVIGFAEMLLKGIAGPLNEEQHECVGTIFERGEELLRLITQILEMSRMEMGNVHLARSPADVFEMIQRSIRAMQLSADKAQISLRCYLQPDALPPALVDRDKVHQILLNLIGNALKFSEPNGEIVVSATLAPIGRPFNGETAFGEESNDAIRISVQDWGIGIASDQLDKIFEAFYQVDASSTREHGGAGLGLSIVRKLVNCHKGEVWVESRVGEGSVFHFTIPLANSNDCLEELPPDSEANSERESS